MIYTGNYKNCNQDSLHTVSISGDKGKLVDYKGMSYPKLAPKKEFWTVWHDNIGKISEEENTKYYIEEYYKQVLSKLDPDKIYHELLKNNYYVLLCYEDNLDFCHRHIVSSWFNLFLDIEVPEIKIVNNKKNIILKPENMDFITNVLEECIRKDINMYNFNCIRAAYLYDMSALIDKEIILNKRNNVLSGSRLYEYTNYLNSISLVLKSKAKISEFAYNKNKKRILVKFN